MDVAVVRFCILFEKKKLERARTGGGCDNGLFYFDVFFHLVFRNRHALGHERVTPNRHTHTSCCQVETI